MQILIPVIFHTNQSYKSFQALKFCTKFIRVFLELEKTYTINQSIHITRFDIKCFAIRFISDNFIPTNSIIKEI